MVKHPSLTPAFGGLRRYYHSHPLHPQTMKNYNNDKNRRPHFSGFWRKIWAEKRPQMQAHLDALNSKKMLKADERVKQVKAIAHLLPTEPMSATRLRDQVAENWNEVYGEDFTSKQAWCLVRLCIKRGLFTKGADGLYSTSDLPSV